MGTTVTTNIALIKPDGNESIKEDLPTFAGWASQNEDNCDVIDGLFRHSNHTYSPAWTADTSNPTLGAGGFVEGKLLRVFPRLVVCYFRIFTGGAGFAGGTGNYRINMPTGIDAVFPTFFSSPPIGKAILLDNDSVPNTTVMTVHYTVSNGLLTFKSTAAIWGPTTPFTLAQNDRASGYFMIPTSDA